MSLLIKMKPGLDPIIDKNTKVLILGSLPSDKSIELQEYYGHRSNDFWKLIGLVLDLDLYNLSYEDKIKAIKENGIGLWDTLKKANRKGSDDSNIKDDIPNDFSSLLNIAPNLRAIFFNGKKSGQYEYLLKDLGYQTFCIPSSSGLNKRNNELRIKEWLKIKNFLY